MAPGKRWEQDFKQSIDEDSCIRLYDTTNGYAGVKNPCDFIYYMYPYQYVIELKSVKSKSFGFDIITDYQWEMMSKLDRKKGITAIFLVEFREEREAYIIPMIEILKTAPYRRSINIDMCRKNPNILEIPTTYKRTHCTIDKELFNILLHEISEWEVGLEWLDYE